MLHEQTREYISGLDNAALLEYVMTGWRMYEPEAVSFARAELNRRGLQPQQIEPHHQAIAQRLAEYDARNPPHLNPGSRYAGDQDDVPGGSLESTAFWSSSNRIQYL